MTTPARERAESLRSSDTVFTAAGMHIAEVTDGGITLQMTVRDDMTNGAGIAHGGWIFLLADTAFGYAATTRRPGTLTTDAQIRFHRPARRSDTLSAHATIVHESSSTVLIDVVVSDSAGERVASFRGSGRAPRTSEPQASSTAP